MLQCTHKKCRVYHDCLASKPHKSCLDHGCILYSTPKSCKKIIKISKTMRKGIDWAKTNGGILTRYPGGYWCGSDLSVWIGTSTVEALVKRGIMYYSEWKEGKNSKFPIEASMYSLNKEVEHERSDSKKDSR